MAILILFKFRLWNLFQVKGSDFILKIKNFILKELSMFPSYHKIRTRHEFRM